MLTTTLAGDLALSLDPARLAEAAGITPDEWQARLLRSVAPRILLNASRQSGKSTTIAALATHTALYDPGLILLLSPGERQSKELFRKILGLWRALGRPVPADAESALTLELANGARIVALPSSEATIRGYSGARLLVVDEASRVLDSMMAAVRPMLAVSGGKLVALSTPWGKRGWWHAEWTEGGAAWERYEIPASQCPRISADFLAEEKRALGPTFFAQEYECSFVETVDSVFAYDDIAAMVDDGTAPLFPVIEREPSGQEALPDLTRYLT